MKLVSTVWNGVHAIKHWWYYDVYLLVYLYNNSVWYWLVGVGIRIHLYSIYI